MFGILKRIFGQGEIAACDKKLPAVREADGSDDDGVGSERRSRFEDFERATRERLEAQSHEMPGHAYFNQLQALQESISDRRYTDAATAARKSLPLIRKWLEDPRGNGKRLRLSMPALTQGGTMLALTGETDRHLYIQTFTRLYVLEGDRLVGLQDCTTKCDLLVDEGVVLLVENKGVRVLTEAGRPLGVVLTKAPIRRAGIEDGVLVVETRTHRGRFSGLMR